MEKNNLALATLLLLSLALTIAGFAQGSLVAATSGDSTADRVLGQPDFKSSSNAPNNPALPSAAYLNHPQAVAVDRTTGRLFVADTNNYRVLSWPKSADFTDGQAADLVLGQPNFDSVTANNISTTTLSLPSGLVADANGNLYVADHGNNRVLQYTQPLTNGMSADLVIGQASFDTSFNGTTAMSLTNPTGLALDQSGNLYVADTGNNRVLRFSPPFTNGMSANLVIGQTGFYTTSSDLDRNKLSAPKGIAVDTSGNLYVADYFNNRVLEFDAPLQEIGMNASRVFGQSDFHSGQPNKGVGPSASSLYSPFGLAVDDIGRLFVADSYNSRVLAFAAPLAGSTAAGYVFGQAGSFTTGRVNQGTGPSEGSLYWPFGAVVDSNRNLLVADTSNNRVLEYDLPLANPTPTSTVTRTPTSTAVPWATPSPIGWPTGTPGPNGYGLYLPVIRK